MMTSSTSQRAFLSNPQFPNRCHLVGWSHLSWPVGVLHGGKIGIDSMLPRETRAGWSVMELEIHIRDDQKLVEIWLNRREREDLELRNRLKPLCQKYHAQKYLVAVFQSGEEPLYDGTRELLLYNRRRQAEREVRREKGLSPTVSA